MMDFIVQFADWILDPLNSAASVLTPAAGAVAEFALALLASELYLRYLKPLWPISAALWLAAARRALDAPLGRDPAVGFLWLGVAILVLALMIVRRFPFRRLRRARDLRAWRSEWRRISRSPRRSLPYAKRPRRGSFAAW